MKFEHTSVMNFENALRGMRNPMNSWGKSDSYEQTHLRNDGLVDTEYIIGKEDMKLAQKLIKAGNDHRKFLRQILVSVDITAPLYWVAEHDTYKVGTTRNSCSFMHKGVSKPFDINDFSIQDKRVYEILSPLKRKTYPIKLHKEYNAWKFGHCIVSPDIKMEIKIRHKNGESRTELAETYKIPQKTLDNILYMKPCGNNELFQYAYAWEMVIDKLNLLREVYIETKDVDVFKEIRQLLPQGYNILYTWQGSYENIRNMYHARKNHKLSEWSEDFCGWVKTLPYAKELICNE